MYPLGHLGIALVIAAFFSIPVAAFVVGIFLPDVVDKGLTIFGVLECGRSAGHNIFFAMGAGLVAFIATRKKAIALAILFGVLLHLAQDSAYFVPYFYPLVQYDFGDCGPVAFQPGAFEIVMEFVGIGLIVFWWKRRAKLFYLRERILKSWRRDGGRGRARKKVRGKKGRDKKKDRGVWQGFLRARR